MPDLTVSFTDAQWTRIVAASSYIKNGPGLSGDVDEAFLVERFKKDIANIVQRYEHDTASVDDFK